MTGSECSDGVEQKELQAANERHLKPFELFSHKQTNELGKQIARVGMVWGWRELFRDLKINFEFTINRKSLRIACQCWSQLKVHYSVG